MGEAEATNRIFDALRDDSTAIEAELPANWVWERFGNRAWARVRIDTPGSLDDPPETLEKHQTWVVENLPKFIAILNPRLERIMGELQDEEASPDA